MLPKDLMGAYVVAFAFDLVPEDLYDEYKKMLANGDKVSYIIATLADKYEVSERKVYDLIRRFKADRNLLAV